MTLEINQGQVNRFRMDRHYLTKRALKKDIVTVVERVCGIQAQMPAAANLQLWVRIQDLQHEDITANLWTAKTLLRTWSMRGTAHYHPTSQFQVFLKAIIEPRIPRHKEWLAKRGIREFGEVAKFNRSQHDFEAILAAVEKALKGGPATREEVANVVEEEVGSEARPWVDTGYYIVTKLLAYEGKVCFGPDLEGKATLVLTNQWLPKQSSIRKEVAEDTVLSQYLQCYGPATPQDFSAWSDLKMATVKPIWERNSTHFVKLTLNEKPVWILKKDLDALLNIQLKSRPLRLLPHFDSFLLGHKDKKHIVAEAHYKRVFKKAAWISPVLLQDGEVIGIWKQTRTSTKVTVTVEPFETLTKSQLEDLEAEAQRLGEFFDVAPEVKVMK
ncbi:MAG: winged helix DNA-binding domain-containing protein [Promethearchaeota archaeon]